MDYDYSNAKLTSTDRIDLLVRPYIIYGRRIIPNPISIDVLARETSHLWKWDLPLYHDVKGILVPHSDYVRLCQRLGVTHL